MTNRVFTDVYYSSRQSGCTSNILRFDEYIGTTFEKHHMTEGDSLATCLDFISEPIQVVASVGTYLILLTNIYIGEGLLNNKRRGANGSKLFCRDAES